MRLTDALAEYAYSKDLTPSARRWYREKLEAFIRYCDEQGVVDVESVTAPLVRHYLVWLRDTPSARYGRLLSSQTVHGYARVVKCFLRWAVGEDLLSEKVPARIEMPRREQKIIQAFSADQIERLFTACELDAVNKVRDRAILAVLLDTGIRANELCTLTLDRTVLSPDDAYLIVNGKGRKQREVGLGTRARLALARYLHRDRPHSDAPQVFLARGGRPLAPEGLDRLLYRLRDKAGPDHFQGVRVSAHTFRHSFATHYLEAGGDIYKLSRLLGHTSVVVTEGYLRSFKARDARRGMSVLDTMSRTKTVPNWDDSQARRTRGKAER